MSGRWVRRRAVQGLLALALLGLAAPVAARQLGDVRARGVLALCAHPNALPFSAKAGTRPGLQIEFARAIAERLDVGLELDWVLVGVHHRRVDCDIIMDTIVEPAALAERDLRASVPYQRSGVALALPPQHEGVKRFADLGAEHKIAVQVGSLTQTILGRQGLKTSPFVFEDEMLAALAAGEVDAAAVSPTSAGWWNLNHPEKPVRIVLAYEHEPELQWDLAVGMRRSDRFLRREIDRIVTEMLDDGTVTALFAAYGVEHRRPEGLRPIRVQRLTTKGEEECIRIGRERDCSGAR
jgi:polar amino acid transport system substrate-binding protein